MQNFIYNSGDYDIAMKLSKKKMTYRAIAETSYRNADGIVTDKNTTYTYLDGHQLNRKSWADSEDSQRNYTGGVSMRYDSKKLIWILQTGIRFGNSPTNTSKNRLLYDDKTSSESEDATYAQSLVPYVNYSFYIYELPRKSRLVGNLSFSYNHNKSSSHYSFDAPQPGNIFNGYIEDAYMPEFSLSYSTPLYKKNYLTVLVAYTLEYYRTQYRGTNQSLQKLNSSYWFFNLKYNHKFSDSWSGLFSAYVPIQIYKVNDFSSKSKPYLNGDVSISGRFGSKHSLYFRAHIDQSYIVPSYYNTVVRQDNEVEGSKGNADLKTQRKASAMISYTWMPANAFSINTSFSWDNIINDVVPYWHEIDGLMVKKMINSGDFNPIYLSITPSVSLFNNKLKINSSLTYTHEWHNGLFHVNKGYFMWYPSVYCDFARSWSANFSYSYGSAYGYMRGSSEMSSFSDNFRLGVQYSSGNLYVNLQANSLFRKTGWVKSYMDSKYLYSERYLSRPWDGRYLSLTVTYTLDFGKKINHGNNIGFDGKSKSSAL